MTQAQEDAVLAALQAARPDHGGPGHGGRGGPGIGNLDAAAKALGVTADELRTALQGGKSLADIAKSKGIPADTITLASTFVSLKWSDPLGASTNDYDLFVLDNTGASIVAFVQQSPAKDPRDVLVFQERCHTRTPSTSERGRG